MRLAVTWAGAALLVGPACLVALLTCPADAKPPSTTAPGRSCAAEIGTRRADAMRRDCRLVAPPNACRPEAACATWTREIARACEAAGADALPVCEIYGPIDDDEEEDE